jgi:hypothetical protein
LAALHAGNAGHDEHDGEKAEDQDVEHRRG